MGLVLRTKPEFPEPAVGLFKPAPYKVMYGGRGSAKSWSFVRALLVLGSYRPLFILHARELQRSIKESVHKLIADQITAMQMNYLFEILDTEIIGQNGTRHVFAGIRNNITAIKSMEAIDVCAVYEATNLPKTHWDILLPTIRRDAPHGPFGQGSEIWVEFNPELADDDTYAMWVANPPPDAVVIEINHRDNPWFPQFLRRQMERMRSEDYDNYLTVWEGKTRRVVEGAIYAKELRKAIDEGRITPQLKPVRGKGMTVTFDLGDQDITSMWFIQQVGTTHNVVDHYSNCGYDITHYLEQIILRKHLVSRIVLPNDAKQQHQAARGLVNNTIEKQVRALYEEGSGVVVRVLPPVVNQTTKINAVRALFPRLQFNEITCADGLKALAKYRYAVHPETKKRSQNPLHDWASHDPDSLAHYALDLQEGARQIERDPDDEYRVGNWQNTGNAQGWMQ